MKSLSFSARLLTGLTLFSMFFGAGNLIFPPFLGQLAGTESLPALAGFAVTAVLFPILGVAAVARAGGLRTLAGRVHPAFAFLFTLLIYLAIGPCLAIPRTAGTSFEMVAAPLLAGADPDLLSTVRAGYSAAFFALAFGIALNPAKLTARLGKVLCPALLALIAVLFAAALFHPLGGAGAVQAPYTDGAVFRGFIEGYQTMDSLAALNFGLIIAMNIRAFGLTDDRAVVRETVLAGTAAGLLLTAVYAALTYTGLQAGGAGFPAENGAQTLTAVVTAQFSNAGLVLLGTLFFIACLNTCVGLLSCCSDYFRVTFPVLSYRGWLTVFAATSCIVANAGLSAILKFSIPVLVAIYPLALVLILLAFLHPLIARFALAYPLTVGFTALSSFAAGLSAAGLPSGLLGTITAAMPLASAGLDWLSNAAAGLFLSVLIGSFRSISMRERRSR